MIRKEFRLVLLLENEVGKWGDAENGVRSGIEALRLTPQGFNSRPDPIVHSVQMHLITPSSVGLDPAPCSGENRS